MANKILAVDDSPIILKLVSQTLAQAGYEVLTVANGTAALQQIDAFKPDLVILDVMMPEMDGYAVCRQIRRRPYIGDVPVMLLTSQNALEEKVKGYEAGADDYVTKPFDPTELQARAMALMRRGIQSEDGHLSTTVKGKIIAVFSLRGGAGVSTIASNLATGLAQLWCTSTALVDLALTGGHSALMLNLSPRATWAEIVRRAPEDIDTELLEQVLIAHPSGAHVLAAPRRIEQSEHLTAAQVDAVLTLLRTRYPYVLLDLPHDFSDLTLEALEKADQILLLVVPELGAILNAAMALETFESLHYPKEKIRLALNQLFARRYLPQGEIEKALQRQMNVIIPYAQETLVPAINNGAPIVLSKPNIEIGALFEDLSFYLSREEDRAQPPATPSPAWSRVSKRAQNKKK